MEETSIFSVLPFSLLGSWTDSSNYKCPSRLQTGTSVTLENTWVYGNSEIQTNPTTYTPISKSPLSRIELNGRRLDQLYSIFKRREPLYYATIDTQPLVYTSEESILRSFLWIPRLSLIPPSIWIDWQTLWHDFLDWMRKDIKRESTS